MASIIEGYTNDIFISYRQKDNKGDRWVSGFVSALKTELEATFKEDISIYFDENPSDGLLETHDVDASLKEKLKCLIFIPVISHTYCDSRSFAWEHEFKAFIKDASGDQFGLKVALPNGNVSSRVLPIRIHDLELEDKDLIEKELGGVLRAIEFIYKEPGVNRPLTPEDNEKKNLNNTRYRNQINKTANAIKEIISGLKIGQPDLAKVKNLSREPNSEISQKSEKKKSVSVTLFKRKWRIRSLVLLLLILCAIGFFVIYNTFYLTNTKKTVAVIPSTNPENDYELATYCVGSMDAIIGKLQVVKRLIVRSRFSSQQYMNTKKSLNEIRNDLRINYLIDISVKHEANDVKMWIGLTKTKTDKQLWAHQYNTSEEQLMPLFTEIVKTIFKELNVVPSPEETRMIERNLTEDSEAYQNFFSGNAKLFTGMGNKFFDSHSFVDAIKMYDKAIDADPGFALAYARRAIVRAWGFHTGQLDYTHLEKCRDDINRAKEIEKDLTDIQVALGFYYYYFKKEYENALKHFEKATEQDPENYQPLFYMALVYRRIGEWNKSQALMRKVMDFNPQEAVYLTNIGLSYTYLHNYDTALVYHQKAIEAMPDWAASYNNKIETMILKDAGIAEARTLLDSAILRTERNLREQVIMLDIYERKYSDALQVSENSRPADFNIEGEKYLFMAKINSLINNPVNAEIYYDSARVIINNELLNTPDNPELLSLSGIAYAGLGNKDKAIETGENAVKLAGNNNLVESDMTINLAQIYTMVGEYDKAVSSIEYLLNNPSCFSVRLLQLDPVWQPLADQPKYQTILREYSKK